MKFKGDESVIQEVAEAILSYDKKVVLFKGDLGAGKTTLIKSICKKIGVKDDVQSPTFSIVNEYEALDTLVYHFDFYRMESEEEAYDIGAEDYFYSGHLCLIEWPEKIESVLPSEAECLIVKIAHNGSERNYEIV